MGRTRIQHGWGETMRVGFIGLGAMGSRMASRLLAAHHDVVVYNRTAERTRPLQQGGAKVAATAKQLAAGVDIVFSSVRLYTTDRKSTRLNSSHGYISYAVFCLKKKK